MHEVLGSNLTRRSGGRHYFLKLGGPLVPVGVNPGLKDFSPGCLLPGGEPGLEGVPHRE